MAEQQILNKHNRILISQTAFWIMVVVNFVIRKIPVEPFDSPLGIAGIALLILGALTRSWAAGYIRKAKELATTGPYALSRNPLYLGAAFLLAGVMCLVPDVLTVVVLLGVFIMLYWTTIRSEEEFLHGRFGKVWEDYIAGTSRFFPFNLGRLRHAFVPGWNFQQWMQNRGWGVYLGIVVLLLLLWVYRVYLR
jgi:protein-S-isoprenylcysteine O-methyltransferase Ste14